MHSIFLTRKKWTHQFHEIFRALIFTLRPIIPPFEGQDPLKWDHRARLLFMYASSCILLFNCIIDWAIGIKCIPNPCVVQGVSPLSYKSKSWNMQICVLIQENYIIFHYHRKRYFHFKVSLDIFNHILCRKR